MAARKVIETVLVALARALPPSTLAHAHAQGFNITFAGENFVGANCTMLDVCPSELRSSRLEPRSAQDWTLPNRPIDPRSSQSTSANAP